MGHMARNVELREALDEEMGTSDPTAAGTDFDQQFQWTWKWKWILSSEHPQQGTQPG